MKKLNINEGLIRSTVLKLMRKHERVPTTREISEAVNLSIPTVIKYIKALFSDLNEIVLPSRTIATDIHSSLIKNALGGCHKSIKLYFQIVYGFRENSFSEEGVVESTPIRINTNPKKSKEVKIDDTKLIE